MDSVNAANYWMLFREALRASCWTGYYGREWTKEAVKAAQSTCRSLGLRTETGYSTCVTTLHDAVGYEWRHCYDWQIQVAFEHEQKETDWKRELCKLSHVNVQLRVLVAYCKSTARGGARAKFQEHVTTLGMHRVQHPGCSWLLVMGPCDAPYNAPYEAFTITSTNEVVPLVDDEPLVPATCMSNGPSHALEGRLPNLNLDAIARGGQRHQGRRTTDQREAYHQVLNLLVDRDLRMLDAGGQIRDYEQARLSVCQERAGLAKSLADQGYRVIEGELVRPD